MLKITIISLSYLTLFLIIISCKNQSINTDDPILGDVILLDSVNKFIPGDIINFQVIDFNLTSDLYDITIGNDTYPAYKYPETDNLLFFITPGLPVGQSNFEFKFVNPSKIISITIDSYEQISNPKEFVNENLTEALNGLTNLNNDIEIPGIDKLIDDAGQYLTQLDDLTQIEIETLAYSLRKIQTDGEFGNFYNNISPTSCENAVNGLEVNRLKLVKITAILGVGGVAVITPGTQIFGGILLVGATYALHEEFKIFRPALSAVYDECVIKAVTSNLFNIKGSKSMSELSVLNSSQYIFKHKEEQLFEISSIYTMHDILEDFLIKIKQLIADFLALLPEEWIEELNNKPEEQRLTSTEGFNIIDISNSNITGQLETNGYMLTLIFEFNEGYSAEEDTEFTFRLVKSEGEYDLLIDAILIPVTAGCGDLSDIDGNIYDTVIIGDQCWMADNLKTTKYSNGATIPNVPNSSQWTELTTGAWVYHSNDASNNDIHGKIYNGYAVVNSNGICPDGWSVPNNSQWVTLINFLGGNDLAGGKMKVIGTVHWDSPNTGATNSSKFSSVPGGGRGGFSGNFHSIKQTARYWSRTVHPDYLDDNGAIYTRYLRYNDSKVHYGANHSDDGSSIRCIKN